MNKKFGFNLTEVSLVLVIIGTVIAITAVMLIKKEIELSNKTRIKKAMSAYETVMAQIVANNKIRTIDQLIDWASADCSNTVEYFKVSIYPDKNNKCLFKTADGLYWNINYIHNPIISLDSAHLTMESALAPDSFRSFYMTTSFVDGYPRVNDYNYEISLEDNALNSSAMNKLYKYLSKQTKKENERKRRARQS